MIEPDLLGDALVDEMAGRRMHALMLVILPDEAWPVEMDHFLGSVPLSETEERVLALCRGSILDIGAGAGRHSTVLQARGHDVHALDISPGAVEVMRARGLSQVHCEDWRSFLRGEAPRFDTVLLLNRGLGLTGSTDGFRELLRVVRGALRPDGRLLTDCMPPPSVSPASKSGERSPVALRGEHDVRLREMYLQYGDREGKRFGFVEMSVELVGEISTQEGWAMEVLCEGAPFAICLTPLTP